MPMILIRRWRVFVSFVLMLGVIPFVMHYLKLTDFGFSSSPYLTFESRVRSKNVTESRAMSWSIRGNAVRNVQARLLVYENGKPSNVMSTKYLFNSPTSRFTGEILLTIQDGSAFGQPEKWAPWLGFSLQDGLSYICASVAGQKSFDVPKSVSRITFFEHGGTVEMNTILFTEFLGNLKGHASINSASEVEARLKSASEGNGIALAVVLSWE